MILRKIVDLMEIGLTEANMTFNGIKVCELGDQRMKWTHHGTGKKWVLAQGAKEHVSIDINGKRGAIPIDLSKKIDRWNGYFDMVTNYGTAEHVENGIYECFWNIHNFTKVGGVMVHAGPPARACPWHSPYHYEPWFFEKLAELAGYRHVISEIRVVPGRKKNQPEKDRSLVCSVLIKNKDNYFVSKDDFININGIEGLEQA